MSIKGHRAERERISSLLFSSTLECSQPKNISELIAPKRNKAHIIAKEFFFFFGTNRYILKKIYIYHIQNVKYES